MQEHVQGHTMKSNGDGHTWGGGRRVVGNAHRSLIVIFLKHKGIGLQNKKIISQRL